MRLSGVLSMIFLVYSSSIFWAGAAALVCPSNARGDVMPTVTAKPMATASGRVNRWTVRILAFIPCLPGAAEPPQSAVIAQLARRVGLRGGS